MRRFWAVVEALGWPLVAALLATAGCRAPSAVVLPLGSYHVPRGDWTEVNPGIALEYDLGSPYVRWTYGAYLNSEHDWAPFGTLSADLGYLGRDWFLGAAAGVAVYDRGPVPVLSPYVRNDYVTVGVSPTTEGAVAYVALRIPF